MPLTIACAENFRANDRQWGLAALRRGQVVFEACNFQGAAAYVVADRAEKFRTLVLWEGNAPRHLPVWCNCSRYAQGFGCGHLWATLLGMGESFDLDDVDEKSYPSLRLVGMSTETADEIRGEVCAGGFEIEVAAAKAPARVAPWQNDLAMWQGDLARGRLRQVNSHHALIPANLSAQEQFWCCIDASRQHDPSMLRVTLFAKKLRKNGEYGKPTRRSVTRLEIAALPDESERRLLTLMAGGGGANCYSVESLSYMPVGEFCLSRSLADAAGSMLTSTGRFGWSLDAVRTFVDFQTLEWDDGPEWRLQLQVEPAEDQKWQLVGRLRRGDDSALIKQVVTATHCGLVLFAERLARLRPTDGEWVRMLQKRAALTFLPHEMPDVLARLASLPYLPELVMPQTTGTPGDLNVASLVPQESTRQLVPQTLLGVPVGRIEIRRSPRGERELLARIVLCYGDAEVDINSVQTATWDSTNQRLWQRDREAEAVLLAPLSNFVWRRADVEHPHIEAAVELAFDARQLPLVVMRLTTAGWNVVADGKLLRQPSEFRIQVTSGQDWFDLEAEVDFGDETVRLPELLEALRRNSRFVRLGDGSQGILPEDWLERYAGMSDLAETSEKGLRFKLPQTLLLDMLLAEQESTQVSLDKAFVQVRDKLRGFRGVKPAKEPRSFRGELRDYQREGLGWLRFLREFGLGGCLADDMGLGKTIQVLALLEGRRTGSQRDGHERRPSLAVVPRSLIFNWIDEAAKFTPRLRVLNYTGAGRELAREDLSNYDLAITTYGTLRRDIEKLRKIHFDYAILDEAQAIKNAHAQASKAVRLLQADHRLAMTGTPIENHLGELWSQMEFLNPGMLGRASTFRQYLSGDVSGASFEPLRRALAPLMLRRTKDQVLSQLPKKTEQTLYCDMKPKQRERYRELQTYYQAQITDKVAKLGIAKAKIHVLEALLRLRQAACDPRLIDRKRQAPGAKIELLLEQLAELREEGHKALVFSQFTKFLALVQEEFDRRKWTYEYLDGKTRNRAECVRHFQNDDECKLFLISLKAGGQGLNLTAADYVFILDPWWNPAVEAQAVDRAHRLGQERPVTAYRIIARDTIEDKILELQKSKRELADAIVTDNQSLLGSLSSDDLQLLFT